MEETFLPYHFALDYVREAFDRRVLPRVNLTLELGPVQEKSVTMSAVLDTGAQVSVFDGNAALEAGWTTTDIIQRAVGAMPIYGIGTSPAIPGYLHEVTVFMGGYARFAELRLRVLFTMPDRLAFSVLGPMDFFEQVDVTFAESDKRLYFRFRNPAVLREFA